MFANLKLPVPDRCSTNTCVALRPHVVPKGHNDLLNLLGQLPGGGQHEGLGLPQACVNLLQHGYGECSCFTSTRLGLGNHIHTLTREQSTKHRKASIDYLDAGHNGSLLDSGGLLEPVGIDTSEKFLSQVHVVKVLANLR